MTYNEVLKNSLVQTLIYNLFDNKETEVIKRPACFLIKLKKEPKDLVVRIILLPPHGYTANSVDEMNPHPEARRAKVVIRGAIRSGKKGFSSLKNITKFIYSIGRDTPTKKNEPYVRVNLNDKNYGTSIKSAKDSFFVVKESGAGFYHNLINLSNDWLVLVLEKYLQLKKNITLNNLIKTTPVRYKNNIKKLFINIKLRGDKLFKQDKKLIKSILLIDINITIPILIKMLNILETGKHEPCTVFALILKKGKQDPEKAIKYLQRALRNDLAPKYYVKELIKKLEKHWLLIVSLNDI